MRTSCGGLRPVPAWNYRRTDTKLGQLGAADTLIEAKVSALAHNLNQTYLAVPGPLK